jgi:hypothetical protein
MSPHKRNMKLEESQQGMPRQSVFRLPTAALLDLPKGEFVLTCDPVWKSQPHLVRSRWGDRGRVHVNLQRLALFPKPNRSFVVEYCGVPTSPRAWRRIVESVVSPVWEPYEQIPGRSALQLQRSTTCVLDPDDHLIGRRVSCFSDDCDTRTEHLFVSHADILEGVLERVELLKSCCGED